MNAETHRTQPEELRRMSWSRAARRAQRDSQRHAFVEVMETLIAIGGLAFVVYAVYCIAMWRPV